MKKEEGLKEELHAVIAAAYAQCREIMLKYKGTWTRSGKNARMSFRALEVACRKLGIPTPPLKKRPDSVIRYEYNAQEPTTTNDTPQDRDIIATSDKQAPKPRKARRNDAI